MKPISSLRARYFCLACLGWCLANLYTSNAEAAYWVSPSGSASWNDCRSDSPLEGTAACSVSVANAHALPGDTVYFRSGVYPLTTLYGNHLAVTGKNGNPDQFLVYSNYNQENVEFKGTYGTRMWGVLIQNSSYVRFHGLIFSDYSDHLIRGSAHHIEISHCTFRNVTSPYQGGSLQIVEACFGGSDYRCPVSHIWVHHCTFYKLSAGGGCSDGRISEGGDALRIGYYSLTCNGGENCAEGLNTNITVEDNYMAYAGHAVMDSYSIKSVFRNNVAHNEPWYPADNGVCSVNHLPEYSDTAYNGLYSHRVWQFTDTYARTASYNLIENNRLGHAGVNPNNDGATTLTIASPGNIVRYNAAYGAMHNAMKTKYGTTSGWQANGGTNNRIYNNTLYKNGYGYPYFQTCTNAQSSTCPKPLRGFRWYYPGDSPGNVLVNNIVYGSYGAVERGLPDGDIQDDSSGCDVRHNLGTLTHGTRCLALGDPLFVNPDLSQTSSLILPDLHLQADSPARDGGTHLTTTVGAGNGSVRLTVQDAGYFQDGTWGCDMAGHQADWIAVGTKENVVQIAGIDYAIQVITLAQPLTWQANDPVWLYKKSDGQRVLYGTAPDYGAYEFEQTDADNRALPEILNEKIRVEKFWAYPNPASERVTFAYPADGTVTVTLDIFQIDGTRVVRIQDQKTGRANAVTTTWNCAGFPAGVYLCRICVTDVQGRKQLGQNIKIALVKK